MSRFVGSSTTSQNGSNSFVWVIDTEVSDRTVTARFRIFAKGAYSPYYKWQHTVYCAVGGNVLINSTDQYPSYDAWASCNETINGTTYKRYYELTSGSASVGNAGGSISCSFSYSVTGTATYLPNKGTYTASGSDSIGAKTGSFNLNILNPDDSEPYSTGEAGKVYMSVNGGSYSQVYNEPASSYVQGYRLRFKNFSPGTGRYLASTSGLSGGSGTDSDPWWVDQGSSTTVTFKTGWNSYYIDLNGTLDGTSSGSVAGYATVDVYVPNTTKVATGVTDYYTSHVYGSTYKMVATATTGHHFTDGTTSQTKSGTLGAGTADVRFALATNTYTVKFYKNDGSSTTATQSFTYGTAQNLTANTWSRTGYTFLGWSTSSTATSKTYSDKQSVNNLTATHNGTVNLYAVWALNAPGSATVGCTQTTRTKMYVTAGEGSGISITNRTVYYRVNGSTGNYSSLSLGTGTSGTITGLQPNTTYQIYSTVTNAAGTATSSTSTFTTMANTPKNLTVAQKGITPFTLDVQVGGSGDTNAGITNYTVYWCKKPKKAVHDMAIKYFGNALWARVFYHQCNEGGTLFGSLNEAKNTQTTDKYSRLYLLDDDTYKGSDGKFEFMLTYPNDKGYTQYNRWKQTNAPQNEFTTRTTPQTVTGYSAVHIDWTANYWGGLERFQTDASAFSTTYIDGSVGHGNWFYAIGAATVHGYGIPSYESTSSNVELWVRIDDQTVSSKSLGTSTTATITGLEEETDYIVWTEATNKGGVQTGAAIPITTPADQAKIRRKNNGVWEKGKTYYKKDGAWVKAKKIYIKIDGQWKIGTNYDPGEKK